MVMTTTTTTTTTLNTITRERKGNGCTRKIKKNNNNNKNNPLLIIHHSNRYLHHFLRWYRIRPGRCWLPTVRFPWEESGASAPKGVWDGGEFGLSPGWICMYQYLSTIHMYSFYPYHHDHWDLWIALLSHAGIGPHYLGGKWSVRTPGVGGQISGDLKLLCYLTVNKWN